MKSVRTGLFVLALAIILFSMKSMAGTFEPMVSLSAYFFTETHDNGIYIAEFSPTFFNIGDQAILEPVIGVAHINFVSNECRSFLGAGVRITWGIRR